MRKNIKGRIRGEQIRDGLEHDRHHQWSRREFLATMGLTGGFSMAFGKIPIIAAQMSPLGAALMNGPDDRIIVLLQLRGGNDGLNTILPLYDYEYYRSLRPTIGIKEQQIIKLNDESGLVNYMGAMKDLWDDGMMKVVQNVGYPNPNLSHFRGTDIWSAASDDEELLRSGWIGRWLDNEHPDFITQPPSVPPAIQIGNYSSLMFSNGMINLSISVSDPEELAEIAQNGERYQTDVLPDTCYGRELQFIRSTTNSTFNFAESIKRSFDAGKNTVDYDSSSDLATQLQLVAKLIKGGLGTRIYMVSISGFDTHADQNESHPFLWNNISETVHTFYKDLKSQGYDENVLTMTFSEFGRRIEENASLGTDHGTAAPIILLGGLQGSDMVGNVADLRDPDENGNLQYSMDFREIYATLLQDWLCVDTDLVDMAIGSKYDRIEGLVPNCDSITSSYQSIDSNDAVRHKAIYNDNGDILIQFTLSKASNVTLDIYSIQGKLITRMIDHKAMSGTQNQLFSGRMRGLSSGQYVYSLIVDGKPYSALITIM